METGDGGGVYRVMWGVSRTSTDNEAVQGNETLKKKKQGSNEAMRFMIPVKKCL